MEHFNEVHKILEVKKLAEWSDFVSSGGLDTETEAEVLELLAKSADRYFFIRQLVDYCNEKISNFSEIDTAYKYGQKLPEFADKNQETLYNLFINIRSDK